MPATRTSRYAQLLYERFNAPDAQALFAEALKLDPKNANALLGMAQIFADSYDPKANDLAEKALEADPKLYQAHELMARMALEDDNQKKAETEADAALAIQADALEATAIRASIDLLADKQSAGSRRSEIAAAGVKPIAHFYGDQRRARTASFTCARQLQRPPTSGVRIRNSGST